MLYQRKISRTDSLAAKLAFQLQTARFAGIGSQVLAVGAVAALLWYQNLPIELPLWCAAMLLLAVALGVVMSWGPRVPRHQATRRA